MNAKPDPEELQRGEEVLTGLSSAAPLRSHAGRRPLNPTSWIRPGCRKSSQICVYEFDLDRERLF